MGHTQPMAEMMMTAVIPVHTQTLWHVSVAKFINPMGLRQIPHGVLILKPVEPNSIPAKTTFWIGIKLQFCNVIFKPKTAQMDCQGKKKATEDQGNLLHVSSPAEVKVPLLEIPCGGCWCFNNGADKPKHRLSTENG